MSSSSNKSYSLQIAERFHNATGKDQLNRICLGGFVLESSWVAVVEKRLSKMPPHDVRRAVLKAGIRWTALYFGTSATLKWAERKVKQSEEGRS
ncbi:uncharacterized protein F4812DRAFT_412845 [Daldinia caldariorum]|uniref:uncharacterized protein n=1 Tax=Daldinia caldariorum TaxID=326644 RepID=UPI0020072213|nr:uncharacterized protein F4812DRAFT_412845 [Daldinia caldariorum]KAI1471127.1 hypothetical protein F4812DRAFT_412845 [Daldinia caldariorum]